jgi:RHS repeat-associated protein
MSDLDRYQYGYDQNSNRLYKANIVGTAAVGQLDEGYGYDKLNRLTRMQRGTLSGGVIASTPAREMDYTLDPTGNWSGYLTATNGTTDLSQGRSSNSVNEITAITAAIGPAWTTPTYDPAGNMVIMPQVTDPTQSFIAQYDAWNRMVSLNTSSGSVASYQYDGRGRRITKYTASSGETRHFYYTNSWQDIEERTGTNTSMDKQYVWGVRYVDELVCRDDTTPQRLYAMQDANFNLTSICNSSGGVVERYVFDPYGNRAIMNGSWGAISASAYNWSIGHQGLINDEETSLLYVRRRYFQPATGGWTQREFFGSQYLDGPNLYLGYLNNPNRFSDPQGLWSLLAWAYTGDGNASDAVYDAATTGGGQAIFGGISESATAGGNNGGPVASAGYQIQIWNPSTGNYDVSVGATASASAIKASSQGANANIGNVSVGIKAHAGPTGVGASADGSASLFDATISSPCACIGGVLIKIIFKFKFLSATVGAGITADMKGGFGFNVDAMASMIDAQLIAQGSIPSLGRAGQADVSAIIMGIGGESKFKLSPGGKRMETEAKGAYGVGLGYGSKLLSASAVKCDGSESDDDD